MRTLISSIIIIVFTLTSINSQDLKTVDQNKTISNDIKNSLRIQPLTLLGKQIRINYERSLQPKISLNSLLLVGYDSEKLILGGSFQEYEVLLETETRYYLSKQKSTLKGWFISSGVLASYRNTAIDYSTIEEESFETFQIGGSLKTGYQWIFEKGFTIGLSGGLDYRTSISKVKNNNDGYRVRFGFSIGYSW